MFFHSFFCPYASPSGPAKKEILISWHNKNWTRGYVHIIISRRLGILVFGLMINGWV